MFSKLLKPGPKYSWKKVLFIVVLSSCCLSGGTTATYLFLRYIQLLHATNEASVIQIIVQTSTQYAPLQTAYLSEVLELSQERPTNFSRFDLDEAKERLMATHVIQEARMKKIKPNMLYIDYDMRQPIAYLGDYTNTALDGEGVFFPYEPFYPPRRLPQIYLGSEAPPNPWGKQLDKNQLDLVCAILSRFDVGVIERIDLSQSASSSAGRRQIVLVLQNGTILRLTPKNYAQELTNYHILAAQVSIDKGCVMDFRNPQVAYIRHKGQ